MKTFGAVVFKAVGQCMWDWLKINYRPCGHVHGIEGTCHPVCLHSAQRGLLIMFLIVYGGLWHDEWAIQALASQTILSGSIVDSDIFLGVLNNKENIEHHQLHSLNTVSPTVIWLWKYYTLFHHLLLTNPKKAR